MVRKREDTADGCRELAFDDRARAADVVGSDHMRNTLERSADAWVERAKLLERLEASFSARIGAEAAQQERGLERNDDG
jgi:hypothetical protein